MWKMGKYCEQVFMEGLIPSANDIQDMGEDEPDIILKDVENAMQYMKIRKAQALKDIQAELIKNTRKNSTKYFMSN